MNISTTSWHGADAVRLVPDVSTSASYHAAMDTSLTQQQTGPARRPRVGAAGWPSLMLCALLTACGGGDNDNSPPPGSGNNPDVQGNCSLGTQSEFQKALMDRINAERAAGADCGSAGVFAATTAVTWNDLLRQASDNHALDMSQKNYFSHTSTDGRTLGNRVTAVGYPWTTLGENIAAGQADVKAVMDAWMSSPGHCANIMSPSFKEVGVACELAASTSNTYKTYWVMDLGSRQ